nr:hypothetical protein B0A51_07669 [Rachicladosporium sp. CCFEE 5018]
MTDPRFERLLLYALDVCVAEFEAEAVGSVDTDIGGGEAIDSVIPLSVPDGVVGMLELVSAVSAATVVAWLVVYPSSSPTAATTAILMPSTTTATLASPPETGNVVVYVCPSPAGTGVESVIMVVWTGSTELPASTAK